MTEHIVTMKVYVTGASGYVGRNLLAHLLQRGDCAVALSRSDASSRRIHDAAATVKGKVQIARGELPGSGVDELARGMLYANFDQVVVQACHQFC